MQDLFKTSLDSCLEETERLVPYNNFSNIIIAGGEVVSDRLGGSCIRLCMDLGERIKELLPEANIQYLKDRRTYHHSVFVTNDEEEATSFLLDPQLMFTGAVPIDEVRKSSSAKRFSAYPFVNDVSSHINVRFEDGILFVESTSSDSSVVTHSYDLLFPLESLPALDDKKMAKRRKKKFILKTKNSDNGVTCLSYRIEDENLELERRGNLIGERVYVEGDKDFEKELSIISRDINISVNGIIANLCLARDIYKNLRSEND